MKLWSRGTLGNEGMVMMVLGNEGVVKGVAEE